MAELRLELLGKFALRDQAGAEIAVKSRKIRALLGFLALNADRRHEREMLANFLWGDRFDTQARQSLRQALLILRQLFGERAPDMLEIDDEAVLLKTAAVQTDVLDFENHARSGELEPACAAYRGDLLGGLEVRSEPFERWLNQERARLHDLACEVWEKLGAERLESDEATGAIEAAKQLVTLDPVRESGHRLLIRAYAGAGRRAEAIQHYRGLAETLQRELGVDPDPETTRLVEDIREAANLTQPEPGTGPGIEVPAAVAAEPDMVASAANVTPSKRWRWTAVAGVVVAAVVGLAIWGTYFRGPPPETEVSAADVAPPLSDKPLIAVLPFTNMSGDPEQEYFADGITEDITTGLSKFGLFFVISRNSTFAYKGRSVNVQDVARDLGVRYVLEGSVRKSGNRVRITAQLVDAIADKHIWAEKYDRELEDVFEIQDEITQRIVTSVAPEFLSAEMRRAERIEEQNLDAWDAFMRAYWHLLRFTKDDNAAAQSLVRKAIDLDQHRANYHGLLAVTYLMDAFYGWSESRDASFREARESAERALALDDQDTLALRSIGLVHFFSKNHDAALSYYERAVAANPNEAENRALLGAALGVAGDYDAALEQFETAFRLSPRDVHIATWYNYLAVAAFVAGRDEEAAEWARKTVQANPQFPGGYRTLSASYGNLGRLTEAEAAREKLQELLPNLTIAQLRESLPYFKDPDDLARYLGGLRRAGLPEGASD